MYLREVGYQEMFDTQAAVTLLMQFVLNILFVFSPKGKPRGTVSNPPSDSGKAHGSEVPALG